MSDGETARRELGKQRLHVAQDRRAGRRIAHMANRNGAWQTLDGRGAGKMIADETEALFRVKPLAVVGNDARRLLAAVLQRRAALAR